MWCRYCLLDASLHVKSHAEMLRKAVCVCNTLLLYTIAQSNPFAIKSGIRSQLRSKKMHSLSSSFVIFHSKLHYASSTSVINAKYSFSYCIVFSFLYPSISSFIHYSIHPSFHSSFHPFTHLFTLPPCNGTHTGKAIGQLLTAH